jgi:hypothetical protein
VAKATATTTPTTMPTVFHFTEDSTLLCCRTFTALLVAIRGAGIVPTSPAYRWRDDGELRVLVAGDQVMSVSSGGFLRRCGYGCRFSTAPEVRTSWTWPPSIARPAAAAIVHLAALAHDGTQSPGQILAVNVLDTSRVLAAEAAKVDRVICFSSAQVFGIVKGAAARLIPGL